MSTRRQFLGTLGKALGAVGLILPWAGKGALALPADLGKAAQLPLTAAPLPFSPTTTILSCGASWTVLLRHGAIPSSWRKSAGTGCRRSTSGTGPRPSTDGWAKSTHGAVARSGLARRWLPSSKAFSPLEAVSGSTREWEWDRYDLRP